MGKFDGTMLKNMMKETKTTQVAMANYCDVTRETVANWIRGGTMPDGSKLVAIGECLGVDPSLFILSQNCSFCQGLLNENNCLKRKLSHIKDIVKGELILCEIDVEELPVVRELRRRVKELEKGVVE